MVQQKLYTEKQVREAIAIGYDWCHQKHIPSDDMINTFIEQFTHIQLPSDEDINNEADSFYSLESYNQTFERGAKWMRDKLLNK